MKLRGERKKLTIEQKISLVGYLLIPLFFILLYFLMTETYEDIMQGNSEANMSVGGIIGEIFGYIPRLGEFFQHIAVHYMTPQLSLGMDVIFRLITALIASGTIFLSSMFVFGRKLKLQYKDMFITIGILLLLMLSFFSETYTYRFSYANNYILGLFVALAFLLPFRMKTVEKRWWANVGAVLLGFCVGISTEIVPVAFLLIIGAWFLMKMFKKEITVKDLTGKYRLQFALVIGLVAGLAFFYLGGGLTERTGKEGGYAEIYDYVSPKGLLKAPLDTVKRLVYHVWYNMRHILFAVPLLFTFVFVEKSFMKKNKESFFWQMLLIAFCALFVGATSLIAVHDDLYPRFMIPIFVAILLSSMIFVNDMIIYAGVKEKVLKNVAVVVVACCSVLVVDATVAFAVYNNQMAGRLDAIHYNPGGDLIIDRITDFQMEPSPVFHLKQLPPFDWGPSNDNMKHGYK